MFRRTLLVAALLVIGFVSANGAYSPVIDDSAMTYYGAKTGFYALTVQDGQLVATLSARAFDGAIPHNFSSIAKRPSGESDPLTVAAYVSIPADSQRAAAQQLEHVRSLAGINTKNSSWTINHGTSSLDAVIRAYGSWFAQGGLDLVQDRATSTSNVVVYDLSGLSEDFRVMFHAVNGGVQVAISRK